MANTNGQTLQARFALIFAVAGPALAATAAQAQVAEVRLGKS